MPSKEHGCNFLITSMPFQENTRRTPKDVLAFLLKECKRKEITRLKFGLF
jgi:hypothetical protein